MKRNRTVCGLCGGTDLPAIGVIRGLAIARCRACLTGQVLDRDAVDAALQDSYSQNYESELQASKAGQCWDVLMCCSDPLSRARSLLDIGCGQGHFLKYAQRRGWHTTGLEISESAAERVRAKGHQVLVGSITEPLVLPSSCGGFDVITMWDVLEHLPSPGAALRHAASALNPGGTLIVVTPLMGSVYDRCGVALHRLSRGSVPQLANMCWSENHLFRFHPRGIRKVAQDLGFATIRTQRLLLVSLRPDKYSGAGAIMPAWTSFRGVNRWISRAGVSCARLFRLYNKLLLVARRPAQ